MIDSDRSSKDRIDKNNKVLLFLHLRKTTSMTSDKYFLEGVGTS